MSNAAFSPREVNTDTDDDTPRSGRRRRSGLSRLAEKRGLIASPSASSASLRSSGGDSLAATGGATSSTATTAVTDVGLPPPAPKSSSGGSSGGSSGRQQINRRQEQQQQAIRPPIPEAASASVRLGSMKRSLSSQDLASTPEPVDMLATTSAATSADDTSSLASNASSAMRKIPVSDVRGRAFLHGSLCASGLLGADQLDALIADRRVDVMAVTWNMAGLDAKSYPRSLESLLFPPEQEHVPDIYALCFQEVTPDITELLLRCQATVGPNHVLFEYCRNRALLLAVFLRRDLIWFVSVPDTAVISTRMALATKGCAAICFTLFGTSMLFISSHFKHDDANFEKRIHDYQKIVSRLDLPKFTKPVRQSDDVTERFDYVIWSGDLNFRVRTGYGDRQRVDRVMTTSSPPEAAADVADALTAGDELKMAQAEGKIFQNFLEGDIRFPPTYKFDRNSDEYDTSNKQRVPSYTDRILYRCRRSGTARVTAYNSVRELRCSDHRPVYAVINALIRPGVDSIPLSHGRFRHDVYVEGNRRRATQLDLTGLDTSDKASQVCRVM